MSIICKLFSHKPLTTGGRVGGRLDWVEARVTRKAGIFAAAVPETYAHGSQYRLLTDGRAYLCPECGGYGATADSLTCSFCGGVGTLALTDPRIVTGEKK